MSDDILEQQAAQITRDVMPTYDMIPAGFRALRYSPWGNYFSFHAERFRNTVKTYKQGYKEINSDNEIIRQDTLIKTILGVPQLIDSSKIAKADRDQGNTSDR